MNAVDIQYHETNKEMQMQTHFHNAYEIIYILEGKAEFKINDKTYIVGRNDILFISNLENHALTVLEYPYKRYFILVSPDHFQTLIYQPVLASIFKHRPEHFAHVIHLNPDSSPEILKMIESMFEEHRKKEDFWESTLASRLSLIFIYLYRHHRHYFPLNDTGKPVETVLKIQEYIEKHYSEHISLADVSRMFYTDMYYICHLFKRITGFTFREYIILQRIARAKELLFYTSDDITTVGANAGFNNVNHFIRIFKKYEGMTPSRYRKLFEK